MQNGGGFWDQMMRRQQGQRRGGGNQLQGSALGAAVDRAQGRQQGFQLPRPQLGASGGMPSPGGMQAARPGLPFGGQRPQGGGVGGMLGGVMSGGGGRGAGSSGFNPFGGGAPSGAQPAPQRPPPVRPGGPQQIPAGANRMGGVQGGPMAARPSPVGGMGGALGSMAALSDEASKQEITRLTNERDRFAAMSGGMTPEERQREKRREGALGMIQSGMGMMGGRR